MTILDQFIPEHEQGWAIKAACKSSDPDLFFPELGQKGTEAKKICARCPVRRECLDYAIAHEERFGIWGGMSDRERRRIRRGLTPTRGGRLTSRDRADIVAKAAAGMTIVDLADEFDVPVKTVQSIVHRAQERAA